MPSLPRSPFAPRRLAGVAVVAVAALLGSQAEWAVAAPTTPATSVDPAEPAEPADPATSADPAEPEEPSGRGPADATPPDDPARGLRYGGLRRAGAGSRCHVFEMRLAGGEVACTHGPDPAPPGVDVTEPAPLPTVASEGPATALATLPCQGDGTSGARVQLVYARTASTPDAYASLAASLQQWAAQIDDVVNASAAETGGVRRVRYVHDAACAPVVARVTLTEAGDDTLSATIAELRAQGHNRPDRKYLVWADANVYCGIAQVYEDDRPGADNPNNGRSDIPGMVARVDRACWGQPHLVETHELVHTLGSVMPAAPNATGNGHCTDDYDRMCYPDAQGVSVRVVCGASSGENRLDCNHDDYFSTAPTAGSWLATHWNTANSAFLATSGSPPPTTTTTTTPPVTTTTSPPPTTTTTTRPPVTTTTVPVPVATQSSRFIDKAHRELLFRPPTAVESLFWTAYLASGQSSRSTLAATLVTSLEYRRMTVGGYFQRYLGRPASPAESDVVANLITLGWTLEQVTALLVSSDEFYARNGGTPSAYVDALWRFVISPTPDPNARAVWVDQLNRGLVDRFGLAHAFFTSTFARQNVLLYAYVWLLDRGPSASELSYWLNQMQNGLRQEYVLYLFVGSAEYWAKS